MLEDEGTLALELEKSHALECMEPIGSQVIHYWKACIRT